MEHSTSVHIVSEATLWRKTDAGNSHHDLEANTDYLCHNTTTT